MRLRLWRLSESRKVRFCGQTLCETFWSYQEVMATSNFSIPPTPLLLSLYDSKHHNVTSRSPSLRFLPTNGYADCISNRRNIVCNPPSIYNPLQPPFRIHSIVEHRRHPLPSFPGSGQHCGLTQERLLGHQRRITPCASRRHPPRHFLHNDIWYADLRMVVSTSYDWEADA